MNIIYKITNIDNGKVYIGKTSQSLKERFNQHKGCNTTIIGKALNSKKYHPVEEHFTIEPIEYVDDMLNVDAREMYWINVFDSTSRDKGYNITNGGGGINGYKHTDITKEVISSSSTNRKWINDGVKNKFVKENDYNTFLTQGWNSGRLIDKSFYKLNNFSEKQSVSKRGHKGYTNGIDVVYIKEDEIESYVSKGYFPGHRNKEGKIIFDVIVFNGNEYRSIKSSSVDTYYNKGWSSVDTAKEDAELKWKLYWEPIYKERSDRKKQWHDTNRGSLKYEVFRNKVSNTLKGNT